MSDHFQLKNAPIVEAVLDLECDFAAAFELDDLQESAQSAFQDTYPKEQKRFLQEITIKATPDGQAERSASHAIQAFLFLHDDEKQIVQLRREGYSFNRLAPYSTFGDYLPEIHRTWNIYRDLAKPVQVRAVQLRYINRILLPLVGGRIDLDEYFKNGLRLPGEDGLTFTGFLTQCAAVEERTGHFVTTILTAQQPQKGSLPVIFDNTAKAVVNVDPMDWDALEVTMGALRGLKNRVFKNTLTDKCLSLFQ